jgi:DNA-binding transcriptional MerR regulator
MDNLLLIKDLARISGLSVYTLKYYLKLGLIKEAGRSPNTNYRYFNSDTLERLAKIRSLKSQRLSLREILKRLGHGGL